MNRMEIEDSDGDHPLSPWMYNALQNEEYNRSIIALQNEEYNRCLQEDMRREMEDLQRQLDELRGQQQTESELNAQEEKIESEIEEELEAPMSPRSLREARMKFFESKNEKPTTKTSTIHTAKPPTNKTTKPPTKSKRKKEKECTAPRRSQRLALLGSH